MLATVFKWGHVLISRELFDKLNLQPVSVADIDMEIEEGKIVLKAQAPSTIDSLYGVFADKNVVESVLDALELDAVVATGDPEILGLRDQICVLELSRERRQKKSP